MLFLKEINCQTICRLYFLQLKNCSFKLLRDLTNGILDISSTSENSRISQIDRETVNTLLPSVSLYLKWMKRDYEKQIKMLTEKIENLQFGRDSRRSSIRNSWNWQGRSKGSRRNSIFWYHSKFYGKAHRCIRPCFFDFFKSKIRLENTLTINYGFLNNIAYSSYLILTHNKDSRFLADTMVDCSIWPSNVLRGRNRNLLSIITTGN